jgi:peptidoglycan hydrolase-like protein with peptidoglycan-binding domain
VCRSKDEVREAQQKLRDLGLSNGAIDGVLGQETKQALENFQSGNGLKMTATLDQSTMDRLVGSAGIDQGSSTAPISGQGTGSMGSPQPASPGASLGDHSTPQH